MTTPSLVDTIVDVLKRSPTALSRHAIATRCKGALASDVVQALEELKQDGQAERDRSGRWRLVAPDFDTRESPGSDEQKNSHETETESSRWQSFRRLCRYYAECVRNSERPNVQFRRDKLDHEYVILSTPPDFNRLASGKSISIPILREWSKFVESLRRKRSDGRIVIGSPTVNDSDFVEPILTIEAQASIDGGRVRLTPLSTVRHNPAALRRREIAGSDSEQELFLEVLGIDESGREETSLSAAASRLREWKPELWSAKRSGSTGLPVRDEVLVGFAPGLRYSKSLVDELQRIAEAPDDDLDQTALRAVFPNEPAGDTNTEVPDNTHLPTPSLVELTPLNAEQRKACLGARKSPLIVLTGPPGTGKSQVVRHVLLDRLLLGETALFASRNHAAIDAVVPAINALTIPYPLVLRVGGSGERFDWRAFVKELLSRPSDQEALDERETSHELLRTTLDGRASAEEQVRVVLDLRDAYSKVGTELRSIAVDTDLDSRVEEQAHCPESERLEQWISGFERRSEPAGGFFSGLRRLLERIVRLARPKTRMERFVEELARQPSRSLDSEVLSSVLSAVRRSELQAESDRLEREIRSASTLDECTNELSEMERRHQAAAQTWLASTAKAAGVDLPQSVVTAFTNIRAAFAESGGTIDPSRVDRKIYKLVLRVFHDILNRYRLWAVSNLSVRRTTPLAPGIFDILIIDEASQCDVPSTIPLLFRAKRALVSGDPKQLPPILTLSRVVEDQSRRRHALTDLTKWGRFVYTRNSCFDVAYSTPDLDRNTQLIQLRNHYRCHASIIGYSNSLFYGGTLRIRTNSDALRKPRDGALGIRWTDARGPIERVGSSSFQPALTEAIIQELQELATNDFRGTVGVVSPFRAQADRVSDHAHRALPAKTLRQWEFTASTADGFQGGERDVVLLALVGEPGWKSRFYTSDPNRFNVAVTRARAVLHVFGDAEWAQSSDAEIVSGLFDAAHDQQNDRSYTIRHDLVGPVWEPRLAREFSEREIEAWQQYPACGFYLDFALFTPEKKINVEVDGETYHRDATGALREEDVHRDAVLRAAGWTVLRYWVYELRDNIDACIQNIREALK